MNWEMHICEYGDHWYLPETDYIGNDETHASGSIINECPEDGGEEMCTVCRETGKCVHFSDHRDVCTDEIDLSLCSKRLEMGIDVLLGKK